MDKLRIVPMTAENEVRFYDLCAEYLPDSDTERMRHFASLYPGMFLTLMLDDQLIGVVYGWPRRFIAPDDPSFTLAGIAITCSHQRKGYGKRLLSAFEAAAKDCGASVISVGSAGGYVERFYIDCGYFPKAFKVWDGGMYVIEKTFFTLEDYLNYQRRNRNGFIVLEKKLSCSV